MQKLSVVLLACMICAFPQNKSAGGAKPITVTGCVYSGVECLRLKNSKGKQDYSLAKTDQIQVGHAYRITGIVSDFGICQEGKPMLGPGKITSVRRQCKLEPQGAEKK